MFKRIGGVFKLDPYTFEEIEADPTATTQAALVVFIVALIAALGSFIGALIFEEASFSSSLSTLLSVLVGWVVWSAVTWFVGVNLFNGTASVSEMMRVIGFAYAPQALAIIPCIGWPIGIIWSLIAGFIAIRQGLDLDNGKTFLTIVVGVIAYVIVMIVFSIILGTTTALFGPFFV
jgi:uncharacterized membrane protein